MVEKILRKCKSVSQCNSTCGVCPCGAPRWQINESCNDCLKCEKDFIKPVKSIPEAWKWRGYAFIIALSVVGNAPNVEQINMKLKQNVIYAFHARKTEIIKRIGGRFMLSMMLSDIIIAKEFIDELDAMASKYAISRDDIINMIDRISQTRIMLN